MIILSQSHMHLYLHLFLFYSLQFPCSYVWWLVLSNLCAGVIKPNQELQEPHSDIVILLIALTASVVDGRSVNIDLRSNIS